jgi:hypothetical protein
MTRPTVLAAAFLILTAIPAGPPARAGLIVAGSQYTVNNVNFVDTFSENVAFDGIGTVKIIDNGRLMISENEYSTGANSEWVQFNVSTTDGGPLAGDLSAAWQGELDNLQFKVPVAFDAIFSYWTDRGVPFPNIQPLFGNAIVTTNPLTGNGEVYLGTDPGATPQMTESMYDWLSPYDQLSGVGIDPNTANGWHIAGHFTARSITPEPGALVLFALGAPGALGLWWRRRKLVVVR